MIGSSATDRDLTVQRPCDASLLPAGVVELADTPALGAGGFGRGGSNPSARMRVTAKGVHDNAPLSRVLRRCRAVACRVAEISRCTAEHSANAVPVRVWGDDLHPVEPH